MLNPLIPIVKIKFVNKTLSVRFHANTTSLKSDCSIGSILTSSEIHKNF